MSGGLVDVGALLVGTGTAGSDGDAVVAGEAGFVGVEDVDPDDDAETAGAAGAAVIVRAGPVPAASDGLLLPPADRPDGLGRPGGPDGSGRPT